MKLHFLGTANGTYNPQCYNTCFCLENQRQYFLVDGGGGNQIIGQLAAAKISYLDIHDIFISHSHPDHILGIVWVVKKISGAIRQGKYAGECRIYADSVTLHAIKTICDLVFATTNLWERIKLVAVNDGDTHNICGCQVEFFDLHATKAQQFGFSLNHHCLVFCGDEPLAEVHYPRFQNCGWLLHNAFCLDADAEKYRPHQMCHSLVGEVARTAQQLGAKNLVLLHTETNTLATRKARYTQNARQYFRGQIFVPYDLEVLDLVEPCKNRNQC